MTEENRYDFREIAFIKDEMVDSVINLANGNGNVSDDERNVLLLTNSRIVRIQSSKQKKIRRVEYVNLQDIQAVHITEIHDYGGFVWGIIGLIISVYMWQTWNHPILSTILPTIVFCMGTYLSIDHWLSFGRLNIIFKVGSSKMDCQIHTPKINGHIQTFMNRVFEIKNSGSGNYQAGRIFAPR